MIKKTLDKGQEQKEYTVVSSDSAHGRSTIDIKCPFCSSITTAFLWSLAGSGKKCECGAKHTRYYGALRAV